MDDLLKVFLGETAECLAACWIAVDELRENPGDSAALVELLRQVRTVQETSRFLGMSSLNAAASLTLESLESATARRPASIDRIVPIAVDGLQRVEEIIRAIADGEAGTVRHSIRTEATSSLRASAVQAEADKRSQGRVKKPTSPEAGPPPTRQLRSNEALLADLVAAASGGDDADAAPTEGVDGTVRVGADTLNYLLSTVRELVDAQAEMMRRLSAKDSDAERPAIAVPSAAEAPRIPDGVSTAAAPDSPPPAHVLGKAAPGMVRVLLFRDAGGTPKAVHIERVARLEEVDLKTVDHKRGLWVMRSGNELLPLVPFDPAYRLPAVGRAPVIVFTIERDSFGLLVESVPEVADVSPADRADVVLLNGRAIDLLDPARYLDRAIRTRFERRRRPARKRASSGDEVRIALPEDDDLFVRKPLR